MYPLQLYSLLCIDVYFTYAGNGPAGKEEEGATVKDLWSEKEGPWRVLQLSFAPARRFTHPNRRHPQLPEPQPAA